MSYVIKDGNAATQTVASDTVAGAIQPVSSPVDANGNHIASAPGVANPNAALAVQGVAGGVAAPVTFASLQTVSITAAQLPTVSAQGAATAGQSGGLEMGAVSTSAPSYTNGQTSPLSLTLTGALRVDGSGVTQPTNYALFVGNTPINGGQGGLMGVGGAVASGVANSGVNPVKIGYVFNTTQPTFTNGQIGDAQMTARGAAIVATGVDGFQSPTGDAAAALSTVAGANMLYNGAAWDRQRSAPGTTGIPSVDTESVKATYSVSLELVNPGSPGDLIVIQGSGTKTIRIKRVIVDTSATAAGVPLYSLVRRSTNATGGTAVLQTAAKHDPTDAAASAVVNAYTAIPTSGTLVATLSERRSSVSSTSTVGNITWDFSTRNGKAIVVRGTTDFFALSLLGTGGTTVPSHAVTIEWTEE